MSDQEKWTPKYGEEVFAWDGQLDCLQKQFAKAYLYIGKLPLQGARHHVVHLHDRKKLESGHQFTADQVIRFDHVAKLETKTITMDQIAAEFRIPKDYIRIEGYNPQTVTDSQLAMMEQAFEELTEEFKNS